MSGVLGIVNLGGGEILTLGLLVVLFFVSRRIMTWYWKVDRVVELLESIDRKLGGGAPPGGK